MASSGDTLLEIDGNGFFINAIRPDCLNRQRHRTIDIQTIRRSRRMLTTVGRTLPWRAYATRPLVAINSER